MGFDQYLEDAIGEVLEQTMSSEYLEQLWISWLDQENKEKVTFKDFYMNNLIGSLVFLYSSYNSLKMSEVTKEDYRILSDRAINHTQEKNPVINNFINKMM